MENEPKQTPKEDLMNSALKHYEEASTAIHHYFSDVPKAIKQYYSEQKTVSLGEVFECEGQLYAIAISKLPSVKSTLKGGRNIFELDVLGD